jgi:hypothetical protein
MTDTRQQLNELQFNLIGKLFFTACAAWLVGKAVNLKVRGTPQEIQAVTNAMLASHRFQDELKKPGATVDSVMNKLNLKHASSSEFSRILGIPWPI